MVLHTNLISCVVLRCCSNPLFTVVATVSNTSTIFVGDRKAFQPLACGRVETSGLAASAGGSAFVSAKSAVACETRRTVNAAGKL